MNKKKVEIVVVGAGPGGYVAAYYAAKKGKKVVLVEKDENLGGMCLNRGCIPSKALLNTTSLLKKADNLEKKGISFSKPKIDLDKLRNWKDEDVIKILTKGIDFIGNKLGVEIVRGRAYFEGSNSLRVETSDGQNYYSFDKAIIATGSRPSIPSAFDLGNPKILTSKEALELPEIPEKMLVIGGGYIGMELGTVYSRLGSKIHMVEAMDSIFYGLDKDLVRPVYEEAKKSFASIRLGVKIKKMSTKGKNIEVILEDGDKELSETFDSVLVAVGHAPNSENLGLRNTDVKLDRKGFIGVDTHQKTSDDSIYAIGDICGGVMLAHKAYMEAKVAIDTICGESVNSDNYIIPAVIFTDPEISYCGISENDAKEKGIDYAVAKFPWAASGRARSQDSINGLTKLIIEKGSDRIIGGGIVGTNAGELISEIVLAIEMGANARDLAEVVHPHPTLSETIKEAAESYFKESTHVA